MRNVLPGLAVADHPGRAGRVRHSYFTRKAIQRPKTSRSVSGSRCARPSRHLSRRSRSTSARPPSRRRPPDSAGADRPDDAEPFLLQQDTRPCGVPRGAPGTPATSGAGVTFSITTHTAPSQNSHSYFCCLNPMNLNFPWCHGLHAKRGPSPRVCLNEPFPSSFRTGQMKVRTAWPAIRASTAVRGGAAGTREWRRTARQGQGLRLGPVHRLPACGESLPPPPGAGSGSSVPSGRRYALADASAPCRSDGERERPGTRPPRWHRGGPSWRRRRSLPRAGRGGVPVRNRARAGRAWRPALRHRRQPNARWRRRNCRAGKRSAGPGPPTPDGGPNR